MYFPKNNMHRFFCQPQDLNSQHLKITDKDELHHLRDVFRLRVKDRVVVIDGKGREFICEVSQLDKKQVQLNIIEKHQYERESIFPKITVACALPKRSKIDFIIEKLTEIGIDRIILLKTERTEVNLKDFSRKFERLTKIAKESLKQSGNMFLPEIVSLDFKGLLKFRKEDNSDLVLIANLGKGTQNIKDALENNQAKNILIAIGPEGDFSGKEISLAEGAGFISVRLTDAVLKVDTAAIVAAGFIKLYLKQRV